jgi:hypothetical protein
MARLVLAIRTAGYRDGRPGQAQPWREVRFAFLSQAKRRAMTPPQRE